MKKIHEKPPTGLSFGGYVHRNMTGTASGFSHSGNPMMSRNTSYAQQMLRLRPSNDLQLDVLGLPNLGAPHQPTMPRQRPQTQYQQSRRYNLSQSDSHAMEALRTSTRAGSLRQHGRAKTVDDRLLTPTDSSTQLGNNPRKLEPLPKRPPSSSHATTREASARTRKLHGTLPPIEAETAERELLKEGRPLSRMEEDLESSSDCSSESEDEVSKLDKGITLLINYSCRYM